jgi:hypothetical protein
LPFGGPSIGWDEALYTWVEEAQDDEEVEA